MKIIVFLFLNQKFLSSVFSFIHSFMVMVAWIQYSCLDFSIFPIPFFRITSKTFICFGLNAFHIKWCFSILFRNVFVFVVCDRHSFGTSKYIQFNTIEFSVLQQFQSKLLGSTICQKLYFFLRFITTFNIFFQPK